MEKVVLVDGNNLLFRSYYATAYSGNFMKNSRGFPTNGLYGFVNMINKIINEEKPKYMMVAFDIGKTFRHEKYDEYKGGRAETPDELKSQFPVAKEILNCMGIKYLEKDLYEADDIIGTFAKMIDESSLYEGLIVSSDKDLLQLISDKVTVKLLKTKDYIMMNHDTFVDTYGIEPIRMIDLKGLMGDASDNIPGVKGIGEKTALKLLSTYDTIEDIYNNIEQIKGAVKNKLIDGRKQAIDSKDLATIYREVPLDVTFDDIKYTYTFSEELMDLYKELEFYSFIKKNDIMMVLEDFDDKAAPYSTAKGLLYFLDHVDHLKCAFDTGNFLYSEENSYEVLPSFLNVIGHVHCKDRTFSYKEGEIPKKTIKGREMYSCAVGNGVIEMKKIVHLILQSGYDDYFAIEHFGSLCQLSDIKTSAEMLNKFELERE